MSAQLKVWVGAGSNVEPVPHLRLAVAALDAEVGPLQLSGVYRNPPVGFSGADFLNMVIGFETSLSCNQVNEVLESIHQQVGRVSGEQQFGPRTLDLDLLLLGELVDPLLRVPRADVLRYAFALGPLADSAPALIHPITGVTMADAWTNFSGPRELENLGPLEGLKDDGITGRAAGER